MPYTRTLNIPFYNESKFKSLKYYENAINYNAKTVTEKRMYTHLILNRYKHYVM